MADNQTPPEVTEANLEEMTNAVLGGEVPEPAKEEAPEQPVEAKPEEPAPEATPPEQAEPVQQTFEWLKETPYKSPEDLVKGYKNLQAELTKRQEKIKPFEQFLNMSASDPNVLPLLQNALALYQNPQLQQAYRNPQQEMPNLYNYDLSTQEGMAKYNQDMSEYVTRVANDVTNTRLSAIEQHNRRDLERFKFKQQFPDADLTEVEKFMQATMQEPPSPYEAAWKLMTYDKIKSEALEQARKEVAKTVETATKTGTPKAASTAPKTTSIDEILSYLDKYGPDAAEKKYGAGKVSKAMQETTNQFM